MRYRDRCKTMDLQLLSERRNRGNLIQFYKLSKGMEKVNWHKGLKSVDGRCDRREQLRGETVKNCMQRQFFFTNNIVDPWNKLPNEIIEAPTVNMFKSRLDKYFCN